MATKLVKHLHLDALRDFAHTVLGVALLPILFNHLSVQKPAVVVEFLQVFSKQGSLERMGTALMYGIPSYQLTELDESH